MRIYINLALLTILWSCVDEVAPVKEKNILDSLGFEDYREIVRHPVSLSSGMDTSTFSKLYFESSTSNFDTISEGEIIKNRFVFSNLGKNPLHILDTKVSCGCTVVQYPTSAIMPGDTAAIEVEFNSTGKSGHQEKSIIVLSNSYPNEHRLYMRGYVKNKQH